MESYASFQIYRTAEKDQANSFQLNYDKIRFCHKAARAGDGIDCKISRIMKRRLKKMVVHLSSLPTWKRDTY